MNLYTLHNDTLTVALDACGAVLHSIVKDGAEYLWQGNARYWARRDANLFPYVGRLTDGQYLLDGKTYPMTIHGFCIGTDFAVTEQTESSIRFTLRSNEKTLSMLLGLILGVLWSVLAYGAYMVVAVDGGMSVGYLLMMLLAAYFLTGLTLFGYQQIAMLELPFGTQLKNAALLIFAGKLRAFFAIVVWVGMLLVPVIYYGLAAYILLAGWVAIGVMTANVIFAPVFSRLFLTGEPE